MFRFFAHAHTVLRDVRGNFQLELENTRGTDEEIFERKQGINTEVTLSLFFPLRLLSTKTRMLQFYQEEFVTRKGDIGSEMYFTKSGVVRYYCLNVFSIFISIRRFF